jgi:hypothetical protein
MIEPCCVMTMWIQEMELYERIKSISAMRGLCKFPDRVRHSTGRWHNEHPGLDFEHMRMPESLFERFKCSEETWTDHVFDAD